MDATDLRTASAVGARNNDNTVKNDGSTLQCNKNKLYQDIGSNPLSKVDGSRPCAVIGPDRVVPPQNNNIYLQKSTIEPWSVESQYLHPPEYSLKLPDYQHPMRNISPRQTYQENMQRIIVPPSYNNVKMNEEANFPNDKNVPHAKNTKNVSETKYCDVPYSVNPLTNDRKSVRSVEGCVSNSVNPTLSRNVPQGWPSGSVNVRHPRPYGAPEVYAYSEYPSCAGPRPITMIRPHRTVHEESGQVYADPYYLEGNVRFKPYPGVKEKYQQSRL